MIKKRFKVFFKTLDAEDLTDFMSEEIACLSPKYDPERYAKFNTDCQFTFKCLECVYDSDGYYSGREAYSVYEFMTKDTNETVNVKFSGLYSSYGGFSFEKCAFVEKQPVTTMQWVVVP